MKPTQQRDREFKFDVPDDGWALPDLSGLIPPGCSVTSREVELNSTYYDTPELGLLRSRLTLRRRTGDDDQGWQLKIPAGAARTEIRLPVDSRAVPAALRQLTLGARVGGALRPVARIHTHRAAHVVRAVDGSPLAEIAVDTVSATRMGTAAVVTRWREVEIELKEGDEALLRRAAKWLRKTGATPSGSASKLARTLDGADATTGATGDDLMAVVRSYLDEQHDAIVSGDLALRREEDVIHATRVATRRYRSVLKVFGDRFDASRASSLDAELKWYAGVLGAVRDLQVLGDHLRSELSDLPDELVLGPVSARLEQALQKDLAQAHRALSTAMRGRRYLALLRELQQWSDEPPVTGTKTVAAKRVEKYLRKAETKVGHRLDHADALPDHDEQARNEALHRARKAAKRARYVAELSEPVLGKSAHASWKRYKKLQTTLGHRQDAVVAVDYLRRLGAAAGTTPGENGFTFGILLANQARRGHLTVRRAANS